MRNLVNYLGLETIETATDVPVTTEQEIEADKLLKEEIQLDDIEYAQTKDEYANKQMAVEETEALEDFCSILSHGLEHGDYHRHMAAAVAAYARRFENAGIEGTEALSLENHSHDNLKAYYQVSNEFFGGMWRKFKKGLNDRF